MTEGEITGRSESRKQTRCKRRCRFACRQPCCSGFSLPIDPKNGGTLAGRGVAFKLTLSNDRTELLSEMPSGAWEKWFQRPSPPLVLGAGYPHVLRMAMLRQYAALPIMGGASTLQVMLVTSRGGGRWIIPKGNPEKKMKPWAVAALEARDEGGVSGIVDKTPLGQFRSTKTLASGKLVAARVTVFRLDVSCHHGDWKESAERSRLWLPFPQAAAFVDDPGLAGFLAALTAASLARHGDAPESSGR